MTCHKNSDPNYDSSHLRLKHIPVSHPRQHCETKTNAASLDTYIVETMVTTNQLQSRTQSFHNVNTQLNNIPILLPDVTDHNTYVKLARSASSTCRYQNVL